MLLVEDEDAVEVPRDLAGEGLLGECEQRVLVLAVDRDLGHDLHAAARERHALGQLEALEEGHLVERMRFGWGLGRGSGQA